MKKGTDSMGENIEKYKMDKKDRLYNAFYSFDEEEKAYILKSYKFCLATSLKRLQIQTKDGVPHLHTCGHYNINQGFEYTIVIEDDGAYLQKTQATIEKGYAVEYKSDHYRIINNDFVFQYARIDIPK